MIIDENKTILVRF